MCVHAIGVCPWSALACDMTVAGAWPDVGMGIGVVAGVVVAGIFENVSCSGGAGLRVGFLVGVVGVGGVDLG